MTALSFKFKNKNVTFVHHIPSIPKEFEFFEVSFLQIISLTFNHIFGSLAVIIFIPDYFDLSYLDCACIHKKLYYKIMHVVRS